MPTSIKNYDTQQNRFYQRTDNNPYERDTRSFKIKCQVKFYRLWEHLRGIGIVFGRTARPAARWKKLELISCFSEILWGLCRADKIKCNDPHHCGADPHAARNQLGPLPRAEILLTFQSLRRRRYRCRPTP